MYRDPDLLRLAQGRSVYWSAIHTVMVMKVQQLWHAIVMSLYMAKAKV